MKILGEHQPDSGHKKYANQGESNMTSHSYNLADTSETNKWELSNMYYHIAWNLDGLTEQESGHIQAIK